MKISQPKKLLTLIPVILLLGVSIFFIVRYGIDDIIIWLNKSEQTTTSCTIVEVNKSHFVVQNIKGKFYDYKVTYNYEFEDVSYKSSCFISERKLNSSMMVKFLESKPEISVLVGGSSVPLKYSAHYTLLVSLLFLAIFVRAKEEDIKEVNA